MKRILILGDSFAADWSTKYDSYSGWSNLLRDKFVVTNLAQAGVSEYKIYKQLDTIRWLDSYDTFIISHTSPYRVHTAKHPVHSEDKLHNNADLIYSDIEYHSKRWRNLFNFGLRSAMGFFNHHYDMEYFETTYRLYRKAIGDRLKYKNYIVVNFFKDMERYYQEDNIIDFSDMIPEHSGFINHLSEYGNKLVYEKLLEKL
jgi:hypothetical protein